MRHEGDWLQRATLAFFGGVLSLLFAAAACAQPVDITPSTPPASETIATDPDPAFTITLTSTAKEAPTETATVTATVSPTATDTPTLDWSATPTQIWPNTPSIIEVTPLGGYETPESGYYITSFEAQYVPVYGLRLRARQDNEEPSLTMPVIRQLYNQIAIFAQIVVYPQGDVWLCADAPPALYVDSPCRQVAAYIVGGTTYGSVNYGN